MKKLVKIISTNKYQIINENEFDSNIHIDRTYGLQYIHENKNLANYITIRNMIVNAVNNQGGFNNLKNWEKEIALIYTKSVEINDAIPYLMSTGLSQDEATYKYLQLYSQNVRNAADSFKERARSAEFMTTIIMYIGQDNAEIFIDNVRNFLHDLTESAIIGTQYGNTRNGFMDYLEDTGDYEGTGASTFFNLPDEQEKYETFKTTLKNILLW